MLRLQINTSYAQSSSRNSHFKCTAKRILLTRVPPYSVLHPALHHGHPQTTTQSDSISRIMASRLQGSNRAHRELPDGLWPEPAAAVQQHLQLRHLRALVVLVLLVVRLLLAQIVGHLLQLRAEDVASDTLQLCMTPACTRPHSNQQASLSVSSFWLHVCFFAQIVGHLLKCAQHSWRQAWVAQRMHSTATCWTSACM